jgi:NAD(P)-dependent dehydrogenase (short-subunit alcohol dehydrogenase family)
MRLADKVSLITGAGAGMGYAAAHLFAREDSAIAVVDIDGTAGNAAAASGGWRQRRVLPMRRPRTRPRASVPEP